MGPINRANIQHETTMKNAEKGLREATKDCKDCGKAFEIIRGPGRNPSYCSAECSISARGKRNASHKYREAAKAESLKRTRAKTRICKACGIIHWRLRQQFCSEECRSAHKAETARRCERKRVEKRRKSEKYLEEYRAKRRIYEKKKRESMSAKEKEERNRKRRERERGDPLLIIKNRIRCRTKGAIRAMNIRKKSSTHEMLGCSWLTLKSHLEKRFSKGMTWDNIGRWHIDHIIPLSSARTEKELIRLAHFSNLQPLWAKDNLVKNDSIVDCQPELILQLP